MKKILILLASATSAFVFAVLAGAYFVDSIANFMRISGENLSAIIIDPEVQILLYLSCIGLIGIFRSRSYRK
jgi:hypothetical protein